MSFLAAISTIFLGGAALTNGVDVVYIIRMASRSTKP